MKTRTAILIVLLCPTLFGVFCLAMQPPKRVRARTATQQVFTQTWTPTEPGVYQLTAVATDNRGATATSEPVTVTIVPAPKPTPTPQPCRKQPNGKCKKN